MDLTQLGSGFTPCLAHRNPAMATANGLQDVASGVHGRSAWLVFGNTILRSIHQRNSTWPLHSVVKICRHPLEASGGWGWLLFWEGPHVWLHFKGLTNLRIPFTSLLCWAFSPLSLLPKQPYVLLSMRPPQNGRKPPLGEIQKAASTLFKGFQFLSRSTFTSTLAFRRMNEGTLSEVSKTRTILFGMFPFLF